METIQKRIRQLYNAFGQRKIMGVSELNTRKPLFFLHRPFLNDQDLLIIFNTKPCRYHCDYCKLPAKSLGLDISQEDILAQFEYVLNELKHSLSVLTRITLSNEGSLFDNSTFPLDTLLTIINCTREIRLVNRLVVETRIEFAEYDKIEL